MTEVMSVANIKKIVVIAGKIGTVAGKAFEDGKISVADLSLVPGFFMIFTDLITIQWNQLLPEIKDISPDEATELVVAFCEAFDIPQKKIEVTIEQVLAVVSQLVFTVLNLINIFKKPAV